MEQPNFHSIDSPIHLKKIPRIYTFQWFSLGNIYNDCLELYGNQCNLFFWQQLAEIKFKDVVKRLPRKLVGYFYYNLATFIWQLEKILRGGREIVLGGQIKIKRSSYWPTIPDLLLPLNQVVDILLKIQMIRNDYQVIVVTSQQIHHLTILPDDFVRLLVGLWLNSTENLTLQGDTNLAKWLDQLDSLLTQKVTLP